MSNKKLFSEFAPVTKAAWKQKATDDLKGADFDKKLVWKTDDNFDVQPFYTREDLAGHDQTSSLSKAFAADPNATGARSWVNFAEVIVENESTANTEALSYLGERGANGVLFTISEEKEPVDFAALLKGIELECCTVSFRTKGCSGKLVKNYFAYLQSAGVNQKKISGYVQNDPIGRWTTTGKEPCYKCVAEAIKAASNAPAFYPVTLCSSTFVNAGSSYTQELAFTFAKLTDYIEKVAEYGVSAKEVFANTLPVLAMNTDYFFEIAKFRATRALLIEFAELYKVDLDPKSFKIAAESSVWAASKYDPYVNMLRSTTEAMSAILGGADMIHIATYDATFGNPSSFSNRIALNISHLIKEESYFDKVLDPAAGSYYIENLTSTLIAKALEMFKAVEAKGGFVAEFEKGAIQSQIAEVRNAKRKDIASRKRSYVGINRYANAKELLDTPECCGGEKCKSKAEGIELLPCQHAAKPFECLRQRTQMYANTHGARPKVLLAGFGNAAMRTARCMFAGDFFSAASFDILPEVTYSSAAEAAKLSAKEDTQIVVICSSDDDYMADALTFVKEFKAAAPNKILVLAGYPAEIAEDLKAAGLDEFIHVRVNTLDALNAFQTKLGIKE